MLDILGAAEPTSLWDSFNATATVFGFAVTLITVLGWSYTWVKLRRLTKAQGEWDQLRSNLLLKYDAALKENEKLLGERNEWIPRKWLEAADNEAASGNEAKAIDILDAGYRRVHDDLAMVLHRMAEYHTSRMIGFDASLEHATARNFARVARGLAPARREIVALADDLESIEVVDGEPLQLAASRFDAADPEEARRVIEAVRTISNELISMGKYRASAMLSARSIKLAKRHGMSSGRLALLAHYDYCQAILYSGNPETARLELEDLLRTATRSLGNEHEDVLGIRLLGAVAETYLGNNEHTLAEATKLALQFEQLLGVEHPQSLFARGLIAQALINLERNDEALQVLEPLLTLHEKALGRENPNTLSIRFYKAKALARLDRFDDALSEIQALMPVHERVKGADHPDVLATRSLEADVMIGKGEDDRALSIISAVLEKEKLRLGPAHLNTLTSELVRLEILFNTGKPGEAQAEIDRVYEAILAISGPDHPTTKRAHRLRDKLGQRPEPD